MKNPSCLAVPDPTRLFQLQRFPQAGSHCRIPNLQRVLTASHCSPWRTSSTESEPRCQLSSPLWTSHPLGCVARDGGKDLGSTDVISVLHQAPVSAGEMFPQQHLCRASTIRGEITDWGTHCWGGMEMLQLPLSARWGLKAVGCSLGGTSNLRPQLETKCTHDGLSSKLLSEPLVRVKAGGAACRRSRQRIRREKRAKLQKHRKLTLFPSCLLLPGTQRLVSFPSSPFPRQPSSSSPLSVLLPGLCLFLHSTTGRPAAGWHLPNAQRGTLTRCCRVRDAPKSYRPTCLKSRLVNHSTLTKLKP